MSPKQTAIIEYLEEHGSITLGQATELVGKNVYHNASKHTGALVANMVKRGLIVKVKRGEWRLPNLVEYRKRQENQEPIGGLFA